MVLEWVRMELKLTILQNKYKKLLIISGIVILMLILIGLIATITPKYLAAKQIERDSTTKCKSYRALEEIAVSIYKNDPSGSDWLSKAKEAEARRKQHKCSQIILE